MGLKCFIFDLSADADGDTPNHSFPGATHFSINFLKQVAPPPAEIWQSVIVSCVSDTHSLSSQLND